MKQNSTIWSTRIIFETSIFCNAQTIWYLLGKHTGYLGKKHRKNTHRPQDSIRIEYSNGSSNRFSLPAILISVCCYHKKNIFGANKWYHATMLSNLNKYACGGIRKIRFFLEIILIQYYHKCSLICSMRYINASPPNHIHTHLYLYIQYMLVLKLVLFTCTYW